MPKVGRAGKAQIRDHKIKQLVRSNRPPNHIRGEVQEQQLHPNPKEFAVCAGLWVAGRACVDCRCERNIYSVHSGRTCLFTHFIACHLSIPTTIWNHWKETETHSHIHSTRVHPHEEERHGRKRGAECVRDRLGRGRDIAMFLTCLLRAGSDAPKQQKGCTEALGAAPR